MRRIQMTCIIDDSEKCENRTMKLDISNYSENDLANVLREIFLTVIKNNIVRKTILFQVLDDIIKEI